VRKICPYRDSIPGPSSPWPVAIPTALSASKKSDVEDKKGHVGVSLNLTLCTYRFAGKSLARPTSRCILFVGENISFDTSLVIYINSANIPPIMIINRIYEH
jgi:hypothetical protein